MSSPHWQSGNPCGRHFTETPGRAHTSPKEFGDKANARGQGAISSTAAKPPGDITHNPNPPVRAPPRLPLLSCLPSSLSCLLNLEDFLGPEETSGLLDFRKGIGGGDNMWSSCKGTEKKVCIHTVQMLTFIEKNLLPLPKDYDSIWEKKNVYKDLKVIKLLTETENFASVRFVAGCVRKPCSSCMAHITSNHTLTHGPFFAVLPS